MFKKYVANTEQEAIMMAKEEMGSDAIVTSIKTMKPKGLFRFLRKTKVEITAAVDTNPVQKDEYTPKEGKELAKEFRKAFEEADRSNRENELEERKASAIEEKLNNLAELLEKQTATKKEEAASATESETESKMVSLIYNQLVANEVTPEYAKEIIREIEHGTKELQLDDFLSSVYQKIVLKLGPVKVIEPGESKPKVIFFLGPTGVGKTTTIAKLASKYKLEQKMQIGIITSDTYRIAAVEQIRTYANILSIPIEVVYSPEEMTKALRHFEGYDLVFVDTAGRSHKNKEQCEDIENLLEKVIDYELEVYLVLSATTKYGDLLKIAETYSNFTNFRIIFTKIDETSTLGSILNIRMATHAPVSYVACGQNVPDDINVADAQYIAKQLLGGNE